MSQKTKQNRRPPVVSVSRILLVGLFRLGSKQNGGQYDPFLFTSGHWLIRIFVSKNIIEMTGRKLFANHFGQMKQKGVSIFTQALIHMSEQFARLIMQIDGNAFDRIAAAIYIAKDVSSFNSYR